VNVLFLTLVDFQTLEEKGLYTDLMREFVKQGHRVYIISPSERRHRLPTELLDYGAYHILKLQIGNTQKTNSWEKGVSTVTLETKFARGIQEYFANVQFGLVLYSTPPITLGKAVEYVKRRDGAKAYLLLKDIFPQNAVDLGLLSKTGLKGLVYRYFRAKEKRLYTLSDYIGCMSQANVDYVLRHNPELAPAYVEVCPNSIEPLPVEKYGLSKAEVRARYAIPQAKTVFLYGGNLGQPQGIDFLIRCLQDQQANEEAYFVIVGSGTEFPKLQAYFDSEQPANAQLLRQLPKEEYDLLANACDVGLIFLDHRFTIPNFPYRLLSYMQSTLPVLAATDVHTDLGQVLVQNQLGLWCASGDLEAFRQNVQRLSDAGIRNQMGENARKYLELTYSARRSYEVIISHFS